MSKLPTYVGAFAGIAHLENIDPRKIVHEAAQGYDDEDSFIQDFWMLADEVIVDVTEGELLAWYSSDPKPNLEYMDRYITEFWDERNAPQFPSLDILFGGLHVAMEDLLTSTFDELSQDQALPWQAPECFYCHARTEDGKNDRIGQWSCHDCWDEGIDGAW